VAAAISKAMPGGRSNSMARPKLAASLFRMVAAVVSPVEICRAIFPASFRAFAPSLNDRRRRWPLVKPATSKQR